MLNSRALFALLIVACATGLIISCGGSSASLGLSADEVAILEAPRCAPNTQPDAIGMPSEERIFGWIRDLTLFGNRRTGSIGGMKAAAFMKCQFESLGLVDVHYETAKTMSWEATKSSLSVAGQPIDSSPVPFTMITTTKPTTFSTPPGGVDAELVDIGLGTPAEVYAKSVKGKIAVFDLKFLVPTLALAPLAEFFWDPDLTIADPSSLNPNPFQTQYADIIETIIDAGAVGYIGVLADYFDSNKYYNESYHLQLPVPGMWVAPKDGQKIRDLMAASAGATANMVMEGKSNGEAIGRAVMGVLPGKSKDTILITSHHDAAWNGAVEDASGAASVLAQAQYFASQPAESREKTLLFATMDSHWTGYEVHDAFAKKYILSADSPYKVVGDVSIEHIGKQGVKDADNKLKIIDRPEYRGIFENLSPALKQTMISGIIKHDLRRITMLNATALCPTVGIPTDAFSCVAGIPTASLIAGPNYLYDEADTLDKIAKDQLVPVTKFFAELVEAMDATPSALMGAGVVSPIVHPPSLP